MRKITTFIIAVGIGFGLTSTTQIEAEAKPSNITSKSPNCHKEFKHRKAKPRSCPPPVEPESEIIHPTVPPCGKFPTRVDCGDFPEM